jgi:hypothetical protein
MHDGTVEETKARHMFRLLYLMHMFWVSRIGLDLHIPENRVQICGQFCRFEYWQGPIDE